MVGVGSGAFTVLKSGIEELSDAVPRAKRGEVNSMNKSSLEYSILI
jgi:hypothetical protein